MNALNSPAFQFYPKDWLSSGKVTMMTPEQEGAYIRLLCYDWENDGIPENDQELAILSRLGEGWLKGGSSVVKGCFNQHPSRDGYLTNLRLNKEREKQQEWKKKSSQGGLKSAASRTKNHSQPPLKGGARVVQPKGNSSISSSSSFSKSKSHSPTAVTKETSEHHAFIKGWVEAFKLFHGFDYDFSGRDARAVKALLDTGNSESELLDVARGAWKRAASDKFAAASRHAATIWDFQIHINQIRVELKNENTNRSNAQNPRNVGVMLGPTKYDAEAARRKVERQKLEAANRGEPKIEGT